MLADPALRDLLHRRPRAPPLPAAHAPIVSGWGNSCRVGQLPPTGSTCPFHGARILRVRPGLGPSFCKRGQFLFSPMFAVLFGSHSITSPKLTIEVRQIRKAAFIRGLSDCFVTLF